MHKLAVVLVAVLLPAPSYVARNFSSASPAAVQSDLDAFMEKVLARRDENWKKLQQYILEERERVELRGPTQAPIWGDVREYSWFIRDGYFVRSPVKANGVAVPEDERRKYEERYLHRVKERDKQGERGRGAGDAPAADAATPVPPADVAALLTQTRQPGFIDSAYFLKFKFEQGKYALVGHETLDGQDVLRIEYYPARLFSREQEQEKRRREKGERNRGEDAEAKLEQMMNKVALVTLWVEPKAHQIVKYTFDNANLDFLPAAWLLRVTDLKASMTMSQPVKEAKDLWLPRDVDFHFSAMVAAGSFDVRYHLDYHDYRQATAMGRIRKAGPSW